MKTYGKQWGALLGTSALMALSGCGGGGDGNFNGNSNNQNANLASSNLTGLTSNNRLVTFNSRTPGQSTLINVTGLTTGDTLKSIDVRFGPVAGQVGNNGQSGLYGIGQNGISQQLYQIAVSGQTATATRAGARFDLIPSGPASTKLAIDFNPQVDRLRLVEPTANRNLRLNPNADASTSPVVDGDPATAGVQGDGALAYATGDAGAGQNPDAVGAAYLNPDADSATPTLLYVIDTARNTLTTQGRDASGANPLVNPNTGQLFTIGNLGRNIGANVGFDIAPTTNFAFISDGNQVFGLDLTNGNLSGGARVTGLGVNLIDIAVTSQTPA